MVQCLGRAEMSVARKMSRMPEQTRPLSNQGLRRKSFDRVDGLRDDQELDGVFEHPVDVAQEKRLGLLHGLTLPTVRERPPQGNRQSSACAHLSSTVS